MYCHGLQPFVSLRCTPEPSSLLQAILYGTIRCIANLYSAGHAMQFWRCDPLDAATMQSFTVFALRSVGLQSISFLALLKRSVAMPCGPGTFIAIHSWHC